MEKQYFLCSKNVIDVFSDVEKSIPFKSGYTHDSINYIAVLDFESVEKYYNENEDQCDLDGFWCREIETGLIDVSTITISGIRKNGIFLEIENKTGLTTTRNIVMTINNLCAAHGMNPIEFINYATPKRAKNKIHKSSF